MHSRRHPSNVNNPKKKSAQDVGTSKGRTAALQPWTILCVSVCGGPKCEDSFSPWLCCPRQFSFPFIWIFSPIMPSPAEGWRQARSMPWLSPAGTSDARHVRQRPTRKTNGCDAMWNNCGSSTPGGRCTRTRAEQPTGGALYFCWLASALSWRRSTWREVPHDHPRPH